MAMSETEFLTAEELVEITGYKNFAGQRKWLDKERMVLCGQRQPTPDCGPLVCTLALGQGVYAHGNY